MTASLSPLVQNPVMPSLFPVIPDEDSMSVFFRNIAIWDADANSNVFKTAFVFLVKKAFAFLDFCGIGSCFYSGGFAGRFSAYESFLSRLRSDYARNLADGRTAREKIVNALGGEAMCRTIPLANLRTEERFFAMFNDSSRADENFASGQHIVQGEREDTGRKFVILRLHDSSNSLIIAIVHQLFAETDSNGSFWVANFLPPRPRIEGVDNVVNFINGINPPGWEGGPLPYSFIRKP